tara:strand:+ start:796 stop:1515 length:720 start_codon:yes stop_codon:yes gene_type:complete
MPITTPEDCYQQYKADENHFEHVQDHLFIPAIQKAGLNPLLPKSTGSEIIHAEIIEKLSISEMVLCDMSILNANVFFELGVRTSLNKPVALIVDDHTPKIPFDLSNVNRHQYKSALNTWELESEINLLAKHIRESFEKSQNQNALWKRFKIEGTADFDKGDVTPDDKLNLIVQELQSLKRIQSEQVLNPERGPRSRIYRTEIANVLVPISENEVHRIAGITGKMYSIDQDGIVTFDPID